MAEANTLRGYLVDELHDLVDAEQQLTRALPQMATAATTPALRTAEFFERMYTAPPSNAEEGAAFLEEFGAEFRLVQ